MSDKKIIILALILAAVLIGGGWYYSKHKTPAAILPAGSIEQKTTVSEPGISFGDPNAPVVIEEYTNFLCSACARFAVETFSKIKDEYIATSKVRVIFFVYPPMESSLAGLCAQEQGKFIEYHDYILSHLEQVASETELKDFAANAGLDFQKFNACFANPDKYKNKIQKWYDEGSERGVEATPTFFINGQKFIGAQPYSEFKKIIDEKLNQAK